MTRTSRSASRSLGKTLFTIATTLAFPMPLSRLSFDLSAYELGQFLARRERRRRRARVRRTVLLGVVAGTAAFAAAHARGGGEDE